MHLVMILGRKSHVLRLMFFCARTKEDTLKRLFLLSPVMQEPVRTHIEIKGGYLVVENSYSRIVLCVSLVV